MVIYYGGRETAVLYRKIFISFILFFLTSFSISDLLSKESRRIIENTKTKEKIIYIFISFSMPENLIKEYLEEARQYNNVVFVLRGLLDNNFTKTIKKINELSEYKEIGVIIDPRLYKKYNIEIVPAIVETLNKEENIDFSLSPTEYNKISGSISIRYALETFAGDRK